MWQFFSVRSFYYGVAIQSSAINVPPLSILKMKESSRSFILISAYEGGVGHVYSQSRGRGQRKIFWGGAPDPDPTSFAPLIKIPGGATPLLTLVMMYSFFTSSYRLLAVACCVLYYVFWLDLWEREADKALSEKIEVRAFVNHMVVFVGNHCNQTGLFLLFQNIRDRSQ